ncbi:hypothetical protein BH11PLA2_BH11PLA2_53070 [soil metagenome]
MSSKQAALGISLTGTDPSAKMIGMCTNYALQMKAAEIANFNGVESPDLFIEFYPYRPTKSGAPAKVYNLAPVILLEDGKRAMKTARWGLLPHWANTDQEPIQPGNAQAESIATKPMFKESFRRRDCHRA